MTDSEKELIEGFNTGYIIEKFRPELAQHLLEGLQKMEDAFAEGFIAGSQESILERDKTRSKVISKLKGFARDRDSKPNKNRDKGLDIDR